MAYLAAVSTSVAIPIFIRTKGNVPPLSFPVLGSLNTVHFVASSMKAQLLSCSTAGAKVVWKTFHDSITLILVSSNECPSDLHDTYLLDMVFNSMVLLVGLQELESDSNVERLKIELKCCYPLIDLLLQGGSTLMSPLTQCVDCVAVDEHDCDMLTRALDAFTEAAQSNYGCLSIHGRVCVATESWWELSALEKSLLSLFLCSLPPASCRDIPIYLPKASSRIAHRLLVFTLMEGVEVCVLCNPEPPLAKVQSLLDDYWLPMETNLRNCVHTYPRCVPMSLNFDPAVLAFCLINLETSRCLTSLRPSSLHSQYSSRTTLSAGFQGEMSTAKRHVHLCHFIQTVVDELLPRVKTSVIDEGSEQEDYISSSKLRNSLPHRILETYVCAKRCKAYALNRDNYNFFVLFNSTTPTFSLRKMTSDLLHTLIHGRTVL